VVKYGIGRWREILTAPESAGRFDAVRTGVDLKVRWGGPAVVAPCLPLPGGAPKVGKHPLGPGLAGLARGGETREHASQRLRAGRR